MENTFLHTLQEIIKADGYQLEIIATSEKNHCEFIYQGETFRSFEELPEIMKHYLSGLFCSNKELCNAYDFLREKFNDNEAVERLCWCFFGGFDSAPDINTQTGDVETEVPVQCISCQYDRPFCRKVFMPLTKREQQIFLLAREGLTDKEIAQKLDISYNTIATHFQNALEKVRGNVGRDVTRAFVIKELTKAGL